MLAACNQLGCAFPTRRETATWAVIGLIVGLIAMVAVLTTAAQPSASTYAGAHTRADAPISSLDINR
ncbi:MAG: hypothetical protein AB7G17_06195 [Phycisphaerales bacterium]